MAEDDDDEVFYPTVAFGFSGAKGQEKLHQMWIGTLGTVEWRPVPLLQLGKGNKRPAAIAGVVEQEDEDDEG